MMRNFATGVCVASTYSDGPDGRKHDLVTVNSLTSLSLHPPLVSLCLRRDSAFLADLLAVEVWAVSILDAGAEDIARSFAKDRLTRAAAMRTLFVVTGEQTGALVLDSPAWFECELRRALAVGDHVMAIGEVVSLGTQERRPPLVFLRGGFHVLEDA